MSNSQSVLQKAQRFISAGKPTEAIRHLVAWTRQHSEDAVAWELMARAYFDMGHWPAARMAAMQVTRLRPNSAIAWCNLGTVERKLGKLDEAIEAQQRALSLDPQFSRAKTEIAKAQSGDNVQSPTESAPDAPEKYPPAASTPELENPFYCRQCRRKLSQVVSDENEGLCGTCLRAQLTPEQVEPHSAVFLGLPFWVVGVVLVVFLVGGATVGLMIGRHAKGRSTAPAATENPAATTPEVRAPVRPSQGSTPVQPSPRRNTSRRTTPLQPQTPPPVTPASQSTASSNRRSSPVSVPPSPSAPNAAASRNLGSGSIRGTLTYYFNRNFGDKPDTGSKVYVLKGTVRECPTNLWFYGSPSEVKWVQPNYGSQGPSNVLYRMRVSAYSIADGNGNFFIERLPVGDYTVVLESAHTNGPTHRDISNSFVWKWGQVTDDSTVDVSHDFGMTSH